MRFFEIKLYIIVSQIKYIVVLLSYDKYKVIRAHYARKRQKYE